MSEFSVQVELRIYLGPLLVRRKRWPCRALPSDIYSELADTLRWSEANGIPRGLANLLGEFAINPVDPIVDRELERRLEDHRQALVEVLWGRRVWGTDEVERSFQRLIEQGTVYLELVLDEAMHRYIWETLCAHPALAGRLSIVRIRSEDAKQGSIHRFSQPNKGAHILTIIANPDDNPELSGLANRIQNVLNRSRFFYHPTQFRDPGMPMAIPRSTSEQVRELCSSGKTFNIWFLIVHGSAEHGGVLYYEAPDGQSELIRLADLYTDANGRTPKIFVLFACDIGGLGSRFVNGLLARDIALVVAMQAPINFEAAQAFASLWIKLARHRQINLHAFEKAVKEARTEIPVAHKHERSTPVLYTRARYGWPDWAAIFVIPVPLACAVILVWLAMSIVGGRGDRSPAPPGTASSVEAPTATGTSVSLPKSTPPPSAASQSTSSSEPTEIPTPAATAIPTPTWAPVPPYKMIVIIDGRDYEVPANGQIDVAVKAGGSAHIVIALQNAMGRQVPSGLATYDWRFNPPDSQNPERVGNLNNVLNYTAPIALKPGGEPIRGQLISVGVETHDYQQMIIDRRTIIIRVVIR